MDEKKSEKKKIEATTAPVIPQIKVSSEESERILDQLFNAGSATIEFDVLPNKIKATLRNLNASDQIEIENYMNTVEGSAAFVLHTYTLQVLSYTTVKYGKTKFENVADASNFLSPYASNVYIKT